MKTNRQIPSYIMFGLLMGLVQCSDSAMRSAIYEPDYDFNSQAPAGPSATPPPQTPVTGRFTDSQKQEEETTQDTHFVGRFGRSEQVPSTSTTKRPGRGPKERDRERDQEDNEQEDVEEIPTEMTLNLTNKAAFMKALWPDESTKTKLRFESIRVELKTTQVEESLKERHLEGYLVIEAKDLKTRHLRNDGPVVFANGGAVDIMSAEFRVSKGVRILVENMTRKASRSVEEADRNSWEGDLILLKGEERIKIGSIEGIVNLWSGEDENRSN